MREHNSWKYIHASFMGSLLCFEILNLEWMFHSKQ